VAGAGTDWGTTPAIFAFGAALGFAALASAGSATPVVFAGDGTLVDAVFAARLAVGAVFTASVFAAGGGVIVGAGVAGAGTGIVAFADRVFGFEVVTAGSVGMIACVVIFSVAAFVERLRVEGVFAMSSSLKSRTSVMFAVASFQRGHIPADCIVGHIVHLVDLHARSCLTQWAIARPA
jgi:hypothetical protein